jgi:hypothetical protein
MFFGPCRIGRLIDVGARLCRRREQTDEVQIRYKDVIARKKVLPGGHLVCGGGEASLSGKQSAVRVLPWETERRQATEVDGYELLANERETAKLCNGGRSEIIG